MQRSERLSRLRLSERKQVADGVTYNQGCFSSRRNPSQLCEQEVFFSVVREFQGTNGFNLSTLIMRQRIASCRVSVWPGQQAQAKGESSVFGLVGAPFCSRQTPFISGIRVMSVGFLVKAQRNRPQGSGFVLALSSEHCLNHLLSSTGGLKLRKGSGGEAFN